MLKYLPVLLVALACTSKDRPDTAQAATEMKARTSFDGAAALGYAKTQVDFGPRIPGTPGAQAAGDWIIAQMRQRADTVIVQSWSHKTRDGKTLPLRNILARFRPSATERVLYLTHWDTRPVSDNEAVPAAQRSTPVPGANDGASGVGLFVALGDVLKKTPPAVGVDLLFVDGEDYGSFDEGKDQDVLMGSRWFADHPPAPGYAPIFGVLWDMIGDKDLQIYQEGNSITSAPDVVARVWTRAEDLGYARFFQPRNQYTIIDDHVPLIKKGMHVIDVLDYDYCCHHKPDDTMDKISAASLQIVGDVATSLVLKP